MNDSFVFKNKASKITASKLGDKLVYYNNLQEHNPTLWNIVSQKKEILISSHDNRMFQIANKFRAWAMYEGEKEAEALRTQLGGNLQVPDNYTADYGISIVKGINLALQYKETFNRALTRIDNKEKDKGMAKITGAQFFTEYLATALEEEISKAIEQQIKNYRGKKSLTSKQILSSINLDQIIDNAYKNAIFKGLKNSGDWSASDQQKGYYEFLSELENINDSSGNNLFLEEIKKIYKIEDIKAHLEEIIKDSKKRTQLINKQDAKKLLTITQTTTQKGTYSEIFHRVLTESFLRSAQNHNLTASIPTGSFGIKDDYIFTLGVKYSDKIFQPFLHGYGNKDDSSRRVNTVEEIKKINDELAKVDEGFLVHVNAKDYTLGKNFSGFSSGSNITLKTLEGIIKRTSNTSLIIAQIMNTMKGAIYDNRVEEIEEELVNEFAYLLFDDVTTIGKASKSSRHNLHLMMLDGIYIPISYLFFLMAEAIEDTENNKKKMRQISNITIKPGEIAYENQPEHWNWEGWKEQRNLAYDEITIGMKFLSNFVDIIKQIKGGI